MAIRGAMLTAPKRGRHPRFARRRSNPNADEIGATGHFPGGRPFGPPQSTVLRVLAAEGLALPGNPRRDPIPRAPWPDWLEWKPNRVWAYDFTHFTRARRAAIAILDMVSRKWLTTLLAAEESSTQVEVAFTAALDAEGMSEAAESWASPELQAALADRDHDALAELTVAGQVPLLLAVSEHGRAAASTCKPSPASTTSSTRSTPARRNSNGGWLRSWPRGPTGGVSVRWYRHTPPGRWPRCWLTDGDLGLQREVPGGVADVEPVRSLSRRSIRSRSCSMRRARTGQFQADGLGLAGLEGDLGVRLELSDGLVGAGGGTDVELGHLSAAAGAGVGHLRGHRPAVTGGCR